MRLEHFKSHQDTKTNFKKLPFAAPLNMICDHNATRHIDYHREGEWAAHSEPLPTRNMPVQVFYGNTAITITLVETMQKLALILIMIFFKPSITGVTNSGASLLGTHFIW
jgi:hypothetical protein